MSLEGLLAEMEKKKKLNHEAQVDVLKEKHAAEIKSKDKEIECLKEEIECLKDWLDHSALPAFNPISKRNDAMGLVKMNFSPEKKTPELWQPGEKELLESVERRPLMENLEPVTREEVLKPIPQPPSRSELMEEPESRGPRKPKEDILDKNPGDDDYAESPPERNDQKEEISPELMISETDVPATSADTNLGFKLPELPELPKFDPPGEIIVELSGPGTESEPGISRPHSSPRKQPKKRAISFPTLKRVTKKRSPIKPAGRIDTKSRKTKKKSK